MYEEFPKISVIIPVYNVKEYLNQCVESVLHQTYNDFEIILVDDGSTDDSSKICDEFMLLDKRIKVIHKKNGGSSSARNRGLEEASGEYIAFLDSDDYWADDTFLEKVFANSKDEDLIVFRYKKYVEKAGVFIEQNFSLKKQLPCEKDDLLNYLISQGLFISSAWSKIVKRTVLLDNCIRFKSGVTSEDVEWSGKLILYIESLTYADVVGYVYRQRAKSITSTMTKRNIRDLKSNIINSINNGEETLKKTDKLYNVYMSYIAYQFSTLILCAHNVKEDMFTEVSEMKKYAYVLQYSRNKRVVLFNLIRKIAGFKGLYVVAGIYMKFLYNKI